MWNCFWCVSIWHGVGRTVSDSFSDIPPLPLPYKLKLHVSNNSAWRSSENKKSVTILRIWNFPLAANQSFKTQVSKSAKAILAKLQTSSVGESSWAKERINPNILQYNAPIWRTKSQYMQYIAPLYVQFKQFNFWHLSDVARIFAFNCWSNTTSYIFQISISMLLTTKRGHMEKK